MTNRSQLCGNQQVRDRKKYYRDRVADPSVSFNEDLKTYRALPRDESHKIDYLIPSLQ